MEEYELKHIVNYCAPCVVLAIRRLPLRQQRPYLKRVFAAMQAVYEADRNGILVELTEEDL